jgi:preprotein translocase subunit Sec61beta
MYWIHTHSTLSITHRDGTGRDPPGCTPTAGLLGITFVLLSPLGPPSLAPEAALMVGFMRALLLVIAHPFTE